MFLNYFLFVTYVRFINCFGCKIVLCCFGFSLDQILLFVPCRSGFGLMVIRKDFSFCFIKKKKKKKKR
ncbi:hypothetical protein HanRHA438_Chr06g0275211 [Helianthus annuus]|nr:hypothetical protein HanRHA438_Chr06g0275211 [Helianthus annuus]